MPAAATVPPRLGWHLAGGRGSALPWLASALAAALLAGCAASPGSHSPGDQSRDGAGLAGAPPAGDPQAALTAWQSFPVQAQPRPLVLTSERVRGPARGFATGDQKVAYIGGQFELATALPPAPESSGGYAVLTARAAFDLLRGTGAAGERAAHPLRVVKATLGHASFGTDRGAKLLPAWQFRLEGISDAVEVLAVVPEALWPPKPSPLGPLEQAAVTADGQGVTFTFYATPPGPSPCGAEYAGTVAESRTAAVVSVHEVTPNPAGGSTSANQACPALAAKRAVTVRLAAPLGNRVLLTAEGTPVPVVLR